MKRYFFINILILFLYVAYAVSPLKGIGITKISAELKDDTAIIGLKILMIDQLVAKLLHSGDFYNTDDLNNDDDFVVVKKKRCIPKKQDLSKQIISVSHLLSQELLRADAPIISKTYLLRLTAFETDSKPLDGYRPACSGLAPPYLFS